MVIMLSLILLSSTIQFGDTKGCSDNSIEILDPFETTIEYLAPQTQLFEDGSAVIKASMPAGCSVVNTESVLEFDIDELGRITNYRILTSNPIRVHDRAIKRALSEATVLKGSHGRLKNRLRVVYRMYKTKNLTRE